MRFVYIEPPILWIISNLGAVLVQRKRETIRYKGIDANIAKNCLELSTKWGKAGGVFSWSLIEDQMLLLNV